MTETAADRASEAVGLLRQLTGNAASEFRDDQLEVIERLVGERQRMLLVQRTGWGKSAVYFIATRMLRDRGAGPTLLVSPLLALMRNQIEAAQRMGVRAATINSANKDDWFGVRSGLDDGSVDLLLISPERLANAAFRAEVLPEVGRRSGLLVIDEAHCISDWGHDFRPDYRRLVRVLEMLPDGVPVLCCTATANDRVVDDVVAQLGSGLGAVRGPLGREGLALHVLEVRGQAERLAWLAEMTDKLPGTGIVYCLTIDDTERVAGWLRTKGVAARAYSGATDPEERPKIEQALLDNSLKVVVATSALGMGFDKPDLAFVVHFQSPGSPIAYYQQVGRAGRALTNSVGVLLRGSEDVDIQDYFIRSAFPREDIASHVVELLQDDAVTMTKRALLDAVNVRPSQLDLLLKTLEVDGAIEKDGSGWRRTPDAWAYDSERVESVTQLRRDEQQQMRDYAATKSCRMLALRAYLDDGSGEPCGVCDNCSGTTLEVALPRELVQQAVAYLRSSDLVIEPRKQLPDGKRIHTDRQSLPGRTLAMWGDGGWGSLIRENKETGGFDDELVVASAELIRDRWHPDPFPASVAYVPSRRAPELVASFAQRLAAALGLPCDAALVQVRDTEPQTAMENSAQQYRNVASAFALKARVPAGAVLLVDDIVDSRWTITVVAGLLRDAGSAAVLPFALATTGGRST
ncbi:MAG TPA: RecQ family ATP-dependent DNA helicase [Acidimicrobiales bacterium]|nr:RecQ family ATP-dependent DNA helicase [Acidimicrobiales bacterium]